METISLGERLYRIRAFECGDGWTAVVEHADTGDRFGLECTGPSRAEVVERLSHWLGWQHEHVAALADLQNAERAYHRVVAGGAFSGSLGDPAAQALQKESLAELEAATERLDRVRARLVRFI